MILLFFDIKESIDRKLDSMWGAPELPLNIQITLWFGCVLTFFYVFRYALFVMTVITVVIDMVF